MITRIRMVDVNCLLERLNIAMNRSEQAWSNGQSNIGNYHLYAANGCYSLHVIMNHEGGVHSITTGTLREIHTYIRGMLHAVYEMKEKVPA